MKLSWKIYETNKVVNMLTIKLFSLSFSWSSAKFKQSQKDFHPKSLQKKIEVHEAYENIVYHRFLYIYINIYNHSQPENCSSISEQICERYP